jgi:hypothetical protein
LDSQSFEEFVEQELAMNVIVGRVKLWSVVAVSLMMLAPDLLAAGGKGGKGGGHPAAPHVAFRQAAPSRSSYRPPKAAYHPSMPRTVAPRRATPRPVARKPATNAIKRPVPHPAPSLAKTRATAIANQNRAISTSRSLAMARRTGSASRGYSSYRGRQYVHRGGVRRTRGYGYSRRYAVSNQNMRAVVQRLRSTHRSLARLDHDYQGHRVRAMSHIQRAIRQLSHSSMYGRRSNVNRNVNGVNGRNRVGLAANRQRIPQAQSDMQMRRAAQTLQGINTQMTRNTNSAGHASARRSVQTAIRELGIGLQVR